MDIKEFRKLRVGDVVYLPEREPGPSHLRVVQGFDHKDKKGDSNPFAKTISHSFVFPRDIESVVSWEDDGREMDPPWSNQVTVGDPLFTNEEDNGIS